MKFSNWIKLGSFVLLNLDCIIRYIFICEKFLCIHWITNKTTIFNKSLTYSIKMLLIVYFWKPKKTQVHALFYIYYISGPAKQKNSDATSIQSPTSGLRLGLSRNMKLKPLHPNLKVQHWQSCFSMISSQASNEHE